MAAEEMEHKIGSRTWSRTLPARVPAGQHLEGAVGVTSHTGGTRSSSGDLKGLGYTGPGVITPATDQS